MCKQISVIIPFIGDDILWKDLLQDLKILSAQAEIILVGPDVPDAKILARASENIVAKVRYVKSEKGRAKQMNAGAKAAKQNFLWFIHADSRVPRPTIYALENALKEQSSALHYFNLQYLDDGPSLMRVNALVANMRSKYWGMPFGGQGFAISRASFYRVGGFSQEVAYGEDHVFVWEARRKRIPVRLVAATIFTSARSYEGAGWAKLTCQRAYLTGKQAFIEGLKLYKFRVIERYTQLRLNGR